MLQVNHFISLCCRNWAEPELYVCYCMQGSIIPFSDSVTPPKFDTIINLMYAADWQQLYI